MPTDETDARPGRADPTTDAPVPDAAAVGEGDQLHVDVVIVVRVVRTGGFAGLTREWTAEPPPAEIPHWASLIDGCPWDATGSPGAPRGADRFAWRISARRADETPLQAELSDEQLQGPWRELVDEVRSFGGPARRSRD